jgi:hypothetical protein
MAVSPHDSLDPVSLDPVRNQGRTFDETRLLGWAFEQVCGRPSPPFGLLVIVAPDGQTATGLLGDHLAQTLRAAGHADSAAALLESAAVWEGRMLATALARDLDSDRPLRLIGMMSRRRLVIIDDLPSAGAPEAMQGFVPFLDACAATGTTVCVSLVDHPLRLPGLGPALASRLAGGLVVRLPPAPVLPAAVGPAATVTLNRIMRLVARHADLDVETLLGPRRSRSVAAARSLAMYLSRIVTRKSLQAIGSGCGGRDHTTVMHAIRTVTARLQRDPDFAADVTRLVDMLSVGRSKRRRRGTDETDDLQPAADRHVSTPQPDPRLSAHRRASSRKRSGNRRTA